LRSQQQCAFEVVGVVARTGADDAYPALTERRLLSDQTLKSPPDRYWCRSPLMKPASTRRSNSSATSAGSMPVVSAMRPTVTTGLKSPCSCTYSRIGIATEYHVSSTIKTPSGEL
jgi:hypothetical protein